MYMASITLLLFSISTRQMNKANKTEREKCTFFLLRHATSSESFPVFSRSTHTLVVMAVSAESELLKAAAIIPIVKSINTGFPKYPCAVNMGRMSSFIAGSSSCICPARAISKIPRHKNRRFSGIKENP